MPENSDISTSAQIQEAPPAEFPKGMLFVAIIFDILGWIPIVNIVTDIFAGFTLWLWQKAYFPKIDPLISLLLPKLFDLATLGFLPSNLTTVLITYSKKKVAWKISQGIHSDRASQAARENSAQIYEFPESVPAENLKEAA